MGRPGAGLRGLGLAAVLLACPAPAQPPGEPASARAFALRLYDAYRNGAPEYLGRDAGRTFAPSLLALIRRDRATTPAGEVGILDGDPICDCQDAGGLRLTGVALALAGPRRARARVTLRFPPAESRVLTLDLVAERGSWRVADVHSQDTPSLVQLLEDGLRREKR